MDGSIGFSTTQIARNYLDSSFTFQNIFFFLEHRILLFEKNGTLGIIKKEVKCIDYLVIILDTHFIPLKNEPSSVLVDTKLGEP